jgi:thioredoxin-like negative regulator of GroEL
MGRVLEAQAQRPGIASAWLATQPLDAARRERVQREADGLHAGSRARDPRREAFIAGTAGLARLRPVIEACQDGEVALARKAWPPAQRAFRAALDLQSTDYAANLRLAQTLHAMGRVREARTHAVAARDAYPQEAQAHKLAAALALAQRDPAAAWQDLDLHERLLPGDPGVVFLKAVALEALGQGRRAAEHYEAYLGYTARGQAAQYAMTRLRLLGYGR